MSLESSEGADSDYDAFLCYSGRDVAWAEVLHANLTAAGARVFFDQSAQVSFQKVWPDLQERLQRSRSIDVR